MGFLNVFSRCASLSVYSNISLCCDSKATLFPCVLSKHFFYVLSCVATL